jgi:hypothetical protein
MQKDGYGEQHENKEGKIKRDMKISRSLICRLLLAARPDYPVRPEALHARADKSRRGITNPHPVLDLSAVRLISGHRQ